MGSDKEMDKRLEACGLTDVGAIDPSIRIDLRYAGTGNFMGKAMYRGITKAYLVEELAERLVRAQRNLKKINPDYSLVIYDAARPLRIQMEMYESVAGTPNEKYVAKPDDRGGFHNYGMAVDVSILDKRGNPLDMGTPFDYFGEESHPGTEIELMKKGRIGIEAVRNRYLLYTVMMEQGLFPDRYEWWHYQHHLRHEDKDDYILLDF